MLSQCLLLHQQIHLTEHELLVLLVPVLMEPLSSRTLLKLQDWVLILLRAQLLLAALLVEEVLQLGSVMLMIQYSAIPLLVPMELAAVRTRLRLLVMSLMLAWMLLWLLMKPAQV